MQRNFIVLLDIIFSQLYYKMMEDKIQSERIPLLPLKVSLLFFATVLLSYLLGGFFLQTTLGLGGIFLNQILFLLLPTAWMTHFRGLELPQWSSWRWPRLSEIAITLGVTLILSMTVDGLIHWQDRYWPPPSSTKIFYDQLISISSWQEALPKIFVLAITPAFCEEIFFRGILQPSWVGSWGKTKGILITSLAFAASHGNFLYFHFYFILGVLLSVLLEWRGSLWLPIFAHFMNNLWTLYQG